MTPPDVTRILEEVRHGDKDAPARLMPLVYDELRRLADHYLRQERSDHTLQPTALVHEAYLKLIDQTRVNWQNRAHFFGVAAQLMRRILVDHARRHLASKRGGYQHKLSLDEAVGYREQRDVDLLALDDALNTLAKLDPRQSRIVELRFLRGIGSYSWDEHDARKPGFIEFSRVFTGRRPRKPNNSPRYCPLIRKVRATVC